MLNDPLLMKAVTSLVQRSEKQPNESKVILTFVDSGILAQILNRNDQIVYGRRGTGKTHVFQVIHSAFSEDPTNAVTLIDGRTLGSTSQFSDPTKLISHRCTALFRDVLCEIRNCLLEHIVNKPSGHAERAFDSLAHLAQVATEPVTTKGEQRVSTTEKESIRDTNELAVSLGLPPAVNVSAKLQDSISSETKKGVSYALTPQDKVIFPELRSTLNDVLTYAEANLVILFDEWSSLPIDVQPYLAEFLKRSFLPSPKAVLKIASLEYRSRFFITDNGRPIGFELGSDISANIDLDDYYVFDRNPERITSIMAEILFKHISSELPPDYLEEEYAIKSGEALVSRLFTQRPTFTELVRASEGVIRDLINIFITAYFDCQRRGRDNIELRAIEQAAGQWFETDKERNLDDTLHRKLSLIVDEVIGKRRARSFMVERDLEKHPIIQQLSDARIIHLVKRGYADKDNPGRRYSIFTLDYGTYVDLKNTTKQPELDMGMVTDEVDLGDRVVPFEDKRSIRRIILTRAVLESD